MPSISTVLSLSERIQSKIQQDRQSLDNQTQAALRQHAQSLSELSVAALNTTQDDIQTAGKAIRAALSEQHRQIKQQTQSAATEVKDALESATNRLRWALLLPLAATAALCLIFCGATWLYWKAAVPWETVATAGGAQKWQVIKGGGWQMCQGNPCRLER